MLANLIDASLKRRDKLVIMADIARIAKNGALKTQIMYKANLSFTQLNEYLSLMTELELLEKHAQGSKEVYKATKKGVLFLEKTQEVMQLLNENINMGIKLYRF
jgi:predicted transcriptional regulator